MQDANAHTSGTESSKDTLGDDVVLTDMLLGIAKKDADARVIYTSDDASHYVVEADVRALRDAGFQNITYLDSDAGGAYGGGVNEDAEGTFGEGTIVSLPTLYVWHGTEKEGQRVMSVSVEVVYLLYLCNAIFMGGLVLCLGSFWNYALRLIPLVIPSHMNGLLVQYIVTGVVCGIFACLYIMMMWIHTTSVTGTFAMIVAWQTSAMFTVASLCALMQHDALLHVCAIIFLQSLMVVVYTYGQRHDLSASVAFLLMFMVTLLQWAVSSFILTRHYATHQVVMICVLIAGVLTSVYHAFHIRYITHHHQREYSLTDKSRLDALRHLYTAGFGWLYTGFRETHTTISTCRRRWCCRWCGGRVTTDEHNQKISNGCDHNETKHGVP